MGQKRTVFIVGPTAVGKTEAGLRLASLLPVEFISADSMQIYKGMDILTDKLPERIRKIYPYHLVDIIEPTKRYNVAEFCRAAKGRIDKILKKKKYPVVIGGTGLYVNALLYGIFLEGAKDERLRARLEALSQTQGSSFLYEKLKEVDLKAAARIDKNDTRRIIRALEVYEMTKQPISVLQKKRKGLIDDHDVRLFGLRRDRADLYERIECRIDFMMNAGLLGEIRDLLKKKLSPTAYFCIGIREIEGFLKGRYDLKEAVRLMKRNSRRFAKRQMTWFNKNKDIEWIDVKPGEDLSVVARRIFQEVTKE